MQMNKVSITICTACALIILAISNHLLVWTPTEEDLSFENDIIDLNETLRRKIPRIFNLTPMLDDQESFRKEFGEHYIFLIEAIGKGKLPIRFICCLESIVMLNPETPVIVVLSNQTKEFPLNENVALDELMSNSNNLYLATVNVSAAAKGTILEQFMHSDKLLKSPYLPAHISDFLRLCLLWKLGGAYMDLDLLVIRNLSQILSLKNFLTADGETNFNNAFLGFERHNPFLLKFMEMAQRKFDFKDYPSVVRSLNFAVQEAFHVSSQMAIQRRQIQNVSFLDYFVVSPVRHWEFQLMFDEKNVGFYERVRKLTFGYHTWNSNTKNFTRKLNSTAPFVEAARKFCPLSLAHSGGVI